MAYVLQLRKEVPKTTRFQLTEDQKKGLDSYLKSMFEGHQERVARHPVSTQTTPKKEPAIREKKSSVLNIPSVGRDPRQPNLTNFFGKAQPLKSPLEK
jgi:hypothetical protein